MASHIANMLQLLMGVSRLNDIGLKLGRSRNIIQYDTYVKKPIVVIQVAVGAPIDWRFVAL